MANLLAPYHVLINHLQQLVDDKTLRAVHQYYDFAEVMSGGQAVNRAVYVAYDGYSNVVVNAHKNQKMTQKYSVILAVQNNRDPRSNHGHGLDNAGDIIGKIMRHVEGLSLPDNRVRRFTLEQPEEAFYRPGGWAFYPIAFSIDVINNEH